MGTAAAVAGAIAVLAALSGAAAKEIRTYRDLMEEGAKLCRDSEYYSEDNVDKIARYCLLVTEEQDCLQYCIYEKLGMQKEEHWNQSVTTSKLFPLLKEFYAPNTQEKDIKLDIKYCMEKSMLPPEAELIYTDYCEVAEYVHFCIREHFPEDNKEDCYPD
ncbi:hypothetical protein R5R35_010860 [Gryllus longicercus]|uniref:Odorant binding protein n=1 Tax=Gryllus longicercus TaxID=2509291 RepID=A0AAN9VET5_9ORTH